MKFIHILVEGQTEETFVRAVLAPHLQERNVHPTAKLVTTKYVESGPDFKGGFVPFSRLKREITRLLGDTNAVLVTTMIDLYRLSSDFPGQETKPSGSCYAQVTHLEKALHQEIDHPRFLPYLALHEFEAMLFVDPQKIAQAFPKTDKNQALTAIRQKFNSPEEIDDDPQTAPSKRLRSLFPDYQKPLHGPLVILEIGLEQIRRECPHFDSWLAKLEELGGP